MSRSMVEPRIGSAAQGHETGGGDLAQAYAHQTEKDPLLLLDADAWVMITPDELRRQTLDGAPAVQLENLQTGRLRNNARVSVVLHDVWLRHLVVYWPQGVSSRAERAAFLAHRFREVHGVGAPEWALAVDRNSVGQTALASAVPAALVSAIQGFVRSRNMRLDGVVGDFAACFNRWQSSFNEPRDVFGALVVARNGRVTAGLWRDGDWQALRGQPVTDDASATVRTMLGSWTLGGAIGQAAQATPLGELHSVGLDIGSPPGWRVTRCGVRK